MWWRCGKIAAILLVGISITATSLNLLIARIIILHHVFLLCIFEGSIIVEGSVEIDDIVEAEDIERIIKLYLFIILAFLDVSHLVSDIVPLLKVG